MGSVYFLLAFKSPHLASFPTLKSKRPYSTVTMGNVKPYRPREIEPTSFKQNFAKEGLTCHFLRATLDFLAHDVTVHLLQD